MAAGVIIAGGYSTRFGEGDKAIADLAGEPMIRRVAERLASAVDEVVVNCRSEQVVPLSEALKGYVYPLTFAEDPEPGQGPMAGIQTGLRAVDAEYAVVVACDMPFIDPALVDHLFDRAAGHDAAVPRTGDGWFQTTHAVYRASAMADACDAALERDEHKIIEPLFSLDYVVVEESEVRKISDLRTFENINTQAELEEAAEQFR